ncbi:hypothetical protein [Endozoicomonas atrinae]|uniref:hypothetical protein n=1 Tax=Endozoicomonas atrinae TaxID=1333660 RepID=UPI003AFFC810
MEKAWAIIIDDDQAACMMAIPRLFEQLQFIEVINSLLCSSKITQFPVVYIGLPASRHINPAPGSFGPV